MAGMIRGSTIVTALMAAVIGAGAATWAQRGGEKAARPAGPRTTEGRPDFGGVWQAMNDWWRTNAAEGRTSIVFAYALGKAQRVLAGLDAEIAQWEAIKTAAGDAIAANGGTISHHHGIGRVRRDWLPMELGSAYPLLATLRRAVDPLGIMNPGALLPESGSARA